MWRSGFSYGIGYTWTQTTFCKMMAQNLQNQPEKQYSWGPGRAQGGVGLFWPGTCAFVALVSCYGL